MHGRRRFLILFFGGGILGNLAMAIVYFLLLMKSPAMRAIVEKVGPVPFTDGCWLATTALFVAIGRLFGRQALQLWPLPLSFQARYLVGILIGFELAMALSRGDWPAVAGIIVAVGVGFFGAAPGGMTVIRSWYADARDRAKVRSLRRRFGVIDGGDRPPRKFVN